MRKKDSCIDCGLDGGTHKLELYARQDGRENATLPTRRVLYDLLLNMAQHDHLRLLFFFKKSGETGPQSGCNGIEHQDRWNFLAALDIGEHTAADPRL